MKFTLTLIALAIVGIVVACLLPKLIQHEKQSYRSKLRAGHSRFSPIEKAPLPFVGAFRVFCLIGPPRANRIAMAHEKLALQLRCENMRLLADGAIAQYLLVKYGTDGEHGDVCGASDCPIGNSNDAPGQAEDPFTVEIFGLGCKERIVIASEAIARGEEVYTAAGGKVQNLPAGAGTYYLVGRAQQSAGADSEKLRIIPCFPVKTVVA